MTVVLIIIAIIVVLAAILLAGAARMKPTPVTDPIPKSSEMGTDEAVERFRQMLSVPTVWNRDNPSASRETFDQFVPLMRKLYPLTFSQLELEMVNDYGILLTWKGQNPHAAPVVLMAHHDVVEANPTGWSHDPFAATIDDGRIFARGSVDTKCILAAFYEATERLLERGFVPARTVYLWSSNCEEVNGNTTPAVVELFKQRGIEPAFVLDEGGAVIDNAPLGVKNQFAVIGVAEKGLFNALITTDSDGGHASTPALTDATAQLVSGLEALQKNPPAARISAPLEAMLCELAAYSNFGMRIVFGNLWLFRPIVKKILVGNSETAAMVRSTYALTQLEGSPAFNVIPKQARATVNVRVDPGESVEEAAARIRQHFAPGTAVEVIDANEPSRIAPFDDEVFAYLRAVTHSVYPTAGIAPYVQSSCSDARHMQREFLHTYRFAGILFRGDQRKRIHGQDENLDVESFKRGVGFYIELLKNLERLK